MYTIGPRSVVTPDDYSSIPAILAWFTAVVVLLCVAAKLSMKALMRVRFAIDDLTIILALVCPCASKFKDQEADVAQATSIGMDVAVLIATSSGLGRHLDTLTPAQLLKFQKVRMLLHAGGNVNTNEIEQSIFASDIIYGITFFFSKVSTLALLRHLTHVKNHRKILKGLACLLTIWALTVTFGSAFQCSLPDSWAVAGSHCFDQV